MNQQHQLMIERELGMSKEGDPHVVFEDQVVIDQPLSRKHERPIYQYGIFCRIKAQGKSSFMSYQVTNALKARYPRQWALYEADHSATKKPEVSLLMHFGVDGRSVVDLQNSGYILLDDLVNAPDLGQYEYVRTIAESLIKANQHEKQTSGNGSGVRDSGRDSDRGDNLQLVRTHQNNQEYGTEESQGPAEERQVKGVIKVPMIETAMTFGEFNV